MLKLKVIEYTDEKKEDYKILFQGPAEGKIEMTTKEIVFNLISPLNMLNNENIRIALFDKDEKIFEDTGWEYLMECWKEKETDLDEVLEIFGKSLKVDRKNKKIKGV